MTTTRTPRHTVSRREIAREGRTSRTVGQLVTVVVWDVVAPSGRIVKTAATRHGAENLADLRNA